ncbi:MAG TPA: hypothetical protein VEL74_12275 [Thermoanaerobaculia bacterium]|nr:hypothetical protein [Thermoanaerobaculia bacterium]
MRSIYKVLATTCLLTVAAGHAAAGAENLRLDTGSACQERRPDIAAFSDGRFVAVWQQGAEPETISQPRIFARLFGESGTLPDPEFLVSGTLNAGRSPEVAVNNSDQFMVAWLDSSGKVRGRLYGPTGAVLGPDRGLSSEAANGFALTATNDGNFALVTAHDDSVVLLRLGTVGQVLAPPQVISSVTFPIAPHPTYEDPAVAPYGASGVAVAWAYEDLDPRTRSLVFGVIPSPAASFEPVAEVVEPFGEDDLPRPRPAVAANATGQVLAAWNRQGRPGAGTVLRAQVFRTDGIPLGSPIEFGGWDVASVSAPDAVATPEGDFLLAWQHYTGGPALSIGSVARIEANGQPAGRVFNAWNTWGFEGPSLTLDSGGQALVAWQTGDHLEGNAEACFSSGLYARRIAVSSDVLPLRDGRFEVRVHWTDHSGFSGEGRATQLTADSGSFWFFGPENVELMVKVLDGWEINGHFWVFYASLTDVAFTLEVTDTATGLTRTYENPAGQLASRADTSAFPTGTRAAAGTDTVAATASVAARSHVPDGSGAGPCSPPDLPVVPRPGLCLGGRFEVEVAWHIPVTSGAGQGVRLTADSGYLWFFWPDNIELVVKVLDGRAVNGHFWVFYGALSDVEYTVLVRDTLTGQVRTYHNPAGQLRSRADTAAF